MVYDAFLEKVRYNRKVHPFILIFLFLSLGINSARSEGMAGPFRLWCQQILGRNHPKSEVPVETSQARLVPVEPKLIILPEFISEYGGHQAPYLALLRSQDYGFTDHPAIMQKQFNKVNEMFRIGSFDKPDAWRENPEHNKEFYLMSRVAGEKRNPLEIKLAYESSLTAASKISLKGSEQNLAEVDSERNFDLFRRASRKPEDFVKIKKEWLKAKVEMVAANPNPENDFLFFLRSQIPGAKRNAVAFKLEYYEKLRQAGEVSAIHPEANVALYLLSVSPQRLSIHVDRSFVGLKTLYLESLKQAEKNTVTTSGGEMNLVDWHAELNVPVFLRSIQFDNKIERNPGFTDLKQGLVTKFSEFSRSN